MKKLLLSALLTAGLVGVFTSCNNGSYDADPKNSAGTVLNPLNPNSGVTIPIDNISVELNGFLANFIAGAWSDSTAGVLIFTAYRFDTATQVQAVTVQLTGYNGPGTYTLSPDGSGGSITHILYNPQDNNYIALGFTTAAGTGSGTVTVSGTEDGNVRGTFEGTLVQNLPNFNGDNKEVITKGQFYISKL
jgi:hypothetical protein